MSTAQRTAGGVLLAALLAWAWSEREPRAGPPAAMAPAAVPPSAGGPADESHAELEEPRAPERTPVALPLPLPIEAPAPAAEAREEAVADVASTPSEVEAETLVVLVQQDGLPLAGALVLVHGREAGGPPQELDRQLEHGWAGVTGLDGTTVFRGIQPDVYTLRVLPQHLAVLEVTALQRPGSGRRVLAAYGTSAVEGQVYDEAGVPLAGCWILAEAQGDPHGRSGPWSHGGGGQWSRLWAATGPDGAYRIEGLPAGVVRITRTCADEKSVSLVLEPRARLRSDFGWPGGLPTWRGTVRGTDGAAYDVPGTLTTLRLENGERARFAFGADGAFEARLRPGRYAISASGYAGSSVVGEVEIPPGGLLQDVTLPLARVVIELEYAGSDPDPERLLERVRIRLRGPESGWRLAESFHGARRFFRGVPPGDYDLSAEPNPLVGPGVLAGSGTSTLSVPPDQAVVRVRVVVGDP